LKDVANDLIREEIAVEKAHHLLDATMASLSGPVENL
jgi:hypothetical protein